MFSANFLLILSVSGSIAAYFGATVAAASIACSGSSSMNSMTSSMSGVLVSHCFAHFLRQNS
jgi:hypothetical protein